MSEYVTKAVDSLRDYYAANLQAQLTLVEIAESLGTGALVPPDAYLDYPAPTDNRSPLLQIYEEGMDQIVQNQGTWVVPCIVALTYNSAPSDLSDAYVKLRHYLTAIMWTVAKNPTLSGAVTACNFDGADAVQEVGDTSQTRHHYVVRWNVTVTSEV